MLKEVCDYLPQNSKLIVDCTLGHGGHAMSLLSLAKDAKLIGFDVDELMMKKAKLIIGTRDKEQGTRAEERIEFVRGNYADIVSVLA